MRTYTDAERERILSAAEQAIENAGGTDALAREIVRWSEEAVFDANTILGDADPDDGVWIDIRVQLLCLDGPMSCDPSDDPDAWRVSVYTGDPEFDTDVRGYWGNGFATATYEGTDPGDPEKRIFAPMTLGEAREEAEKIIDEALEDLATCL